MKVLLINGSPHKEGCTYTALREVADTLEAEGIETEIVWIGAKPVAGCIACGTCRETGKCVFDDAVNETIAKLPEELREDVIVLEITYANDQTDTKALTVTLQDNGQFFAKFVNYTITDADTFVKRPDAKVVPRAELYAPGDVA